jgi:hypothetical protein
LKVLAKGKTSGAIAKLMELVSDTKTLLTLDDDRKIRAEREISSELIQRNDTLKVIPGEKILTDGLVMIFFLVKVKRYLHVIKLSKVVREVGKDLLMHIFQ